MKTVRIYSTPTCGLCFMAKNLLRKRGIPYEEIDVSDDEVREKLVEESGWRTVPTIFIGEEMIGGYRELAQLDQSGRLVEMLAG